MNKGLFPRIGTFLAVLWCSTLFAANHVAVVAPTAFHRSLEPWIKYRTEQGWTVHVLVEPFGEETATTPQRIRERIRLLAEQVPLSAVLLVGNGASHGNADSSRIVPSPRIPCRLIQYFGAEKVLASDNWYGDLDDDGLPDLTVGRFAVETPEQLDEAIRKTIRFETEPFNVNRRRLHVVAGVGNFSPMIDGAIESTAKYALTESVPAAWDVSLLHLNWKSPFCPDPFSVRREMLDSLGSGSLFWTYLGHGQHRSLEPLRTPGGDFPTLSAEDLVSVRSPNGASIALLFCCYGGVPDATTSSLAEEMFRQPNGPVAVFAASRTTMPYGMSVLGIELLQEATTSAGQKTLGEMILAAERRTILGPDPKEASTTPPTEGPRQRPLRATVEGLAKLLDPAPDRLNEQLSEHVALFHLFGDPLLRLPISKRLELNCAESIPAGSTLNIDGATETDGNVLLELVLPSNRLSLNDPDRNEFHGDKTARTMYQEKYRRANERVLISKVFPVVDGTFRAELSIPEGIHGDYVVRACQTSNGDYALGAKNVKVRRMK